MTVVYTEETLALLRSWGVTPEEIEALAAAEREVSEASWDSFGVEGRPDRPADKPS